MVITSPPNLQALVFASAFLGCVGLKYYDGAVTVQETLVISRIVVTQRKRYCYLAIGQVLLAGCLAAALIYYGPHLTLHCMHEWWSTDIVGKVVVIVNAIAVVSPLMSVLSALWIYRHPAVLAKKALKQRGYLFTADVRAGVPNPRRAWIYKYRDQYGVLRKEYRYDN